VRVALASKGEYEKTELAFFGGSFTAIDREYMISLLETAYEFVKDGSIDGIRISTRPDKIDEEIIEILKSYGVTAVELGAQSMDDEVLLLNRRGHTVNDIENAFFMLKKAGFDTQQALVYTQDESFYREILIDFLKELPERSEKLEDFYLDKNWNDYTVLVHALKTNARTIGALELSDLAASVELASKSMDEITLTNEHAKLLELYEKTAGQIENIIGDKNGDAPDEDDISDDEEILEFMPENEK
jgi:HPt (histidine-containing phosphotransfer) domain-containing protein